jgi:hypothetical protein
MRNNNKLILCAAGLYITCLHAPMYAQEDVIALAPATPTTQESEDIAPPPPSTARDLSPLGPGGLPPQYQKQPIVGPGGLPPEYQKRPILGPGGLPPQYQKQPLTALLELLEWAKANPEKLTEKELNTLGLLTRQASTQPISPQTQDTIAIALDHMFNQRDRLSAAGRTFITSIGAPFLSQAQVQYVQTTIAPVINAMPAPVPVAPAPAPATSTLEPVVKTPSVPTTLDIAPKKPSKPIQVSYANNVKAILKLKKASKIIAGLITLLDQAGTQNVDAATIQEFTKVLNGLTKKSNTFSKTLHIQFTQLLAKAYHSNFLAANQKPHINALYFSLIHKKK